MGNTVLRNYVSKVRARGYSDVQIKSFLLKYGYKKKDIDDAMSINNQPIVHPIINEQKSNASKNYLNKKVDITHSDSIMPIQIKIGIIFNYVCGIIVLIFGFFFANWFFNISGMLKYLFYLVILIIGVLFIFAGTLLSKFKHNAKLIGTIANFLILIFCISMIFVETLNTNIIGMISYFLFLIFPLWNIYIYFEKKYSKFVA